MASRRLTRRLLAHAVLGLIWFRGSAARSDPARGEFLVIVNTRNPASSAPRDFLADAFLKKVTRWDDDESLRPVDLRADSAVRRAFSNSVLRRPVEAVRRYWQQCIFSGRSVPPPELDSDEAIVRYVAKYRGAVGYVSADAKLGDRDVKVLAVNS